MPYLIYCIVSLLIGFILGIVVELIVNIKAIKELEEENKHLRKRLSSQTKIVEIHDNREVVPEDVDWSQTW